MLPAFLSLSLFLSLRGLSVSLYLSRSPGFLLLFSYIHAYSSADSAVGAALVCVCVTLREIEGGRGRKIGGE